MTQFFLSSFSLFLFPSTIFLIVLIVLRARPATLSCPANWNMILSQNEKKIIFLLRKPPSGSHALCTRHCRVGRVTSTIKCAERSIAMMEKWVGYRATIFVDVQLISLRFWVDSEDAVLHPHVIITKVLEDDAQHHVSITSQSVAPGKYNRCVIEMSCKDFNRLPEKKTHSWMKSFPNQKSLDKSPNPCL